MGSYVFKIATQEPEKLLAAVSESLGANSRIAKQVAEQMPKPAIEEPTGDCIVMDVAAHAWIFDDDSGKWFSNESPNSPLDWRDLLSEYADLPRVYRPEAPSHPRRFCTRDHTCRMADGHEGGCRP